MPRPVHFEIHASDPTALAGFYKEVFGWEFLRWGDDPYWLVATGDGNPMAGVPHSEPGIDGAMLPRVGPPPAPGAPVSGWVVTVDVADAGATVAAAAAAGGTVAMPLAPVTGIGWLAYIVDPDGNTFGVLQADVTAGAAEPTGEEVVPG
jgi:hypothetical protein